MAQDESRLNRDAQEIDTSADKSAMYDAFDLWKATLDKKENATLTSIQTLELAQKRVTDKRLQEEIEAIRKTSATQAEADSKIAELKKNWHKEVVNVAVKLEENLYKQSSIKYKAKMAEQRAETAKTIQEEARKRLILIEQDEQMDGNKKNLARWEANDDLYKAMDAETENLNLQLNLEMKRKALTSADRAAQLSSVQKIREEVRQAHEDKLEQLDIEIERLKEQEEQEKKERPNDPTAGSTFAERRQQLEESRIKEQTTAEKDEWGNFNNELQTGLKKTMKDSIGKSIDALTNAVGAGVDKAIDSVGQYKSVIDARLQGTQSSYDDVARTLKLTLGASPFVKQTDVLQKLNDAINKGIAYNVEQRAFLATVTDKIVATFDAFDANLLRIIRLQQADTTVARMGMESQLLQFFNQTFSDNSYLADGYDSVSESLIDANAQMTRDMSISFEFNVQKWLGSLASLGFGTDTITKIATGINYLGSGNVQALSSDTELMNLMAMSASRAGYSISDLLVQGIDDSSVNDLLKSMVEYLAEIADSNNAVVKAAYGDVFNFSQSDLRAISNLTNKDISNIYKQSMDYSKATLETQLQLLQVSTRLSMTEMINNAFDNFMYTAGESIGSDPLTALTWKTLSVLDSVTGGDLKIPEIMIGGFGVNITSSIPNLLKLGIFGLSAIGNLGYTVTSLLTAGGLNLGMWGADEYTKRGGDFQSNVGGVQKTTSGSKSVVTSSASSDSKKSAIDSTSDDQEESKKRSKESAKGEITLEVLYKEIFEKKSPVYVVDTPVLNQMTNISSAIASVNTNIKSIADKIHNEENPIKVSVINFGELLLGMGKNTTKLHEESATLIATQIVAELGKQNTFVNINNIAEDIDSISSDIKTTTISVSDSTTHDALTALQSTLNGQ